ncbi:transcriptional regulator [Burkholderia sp. Nafp2/4-1b]|uniref:winged helix-turn-helix domain-containing protein n=1 Tax=Burkholderia sp. Nafp2/4-1b TaxID=2116686 RepID=UPI000EF86D20|nr:winged helix-turn-helix domain-containing protein [Burkholderia sp. Nafp2/4-1b]RKT98672.1 transcriptional regulator [Burkholderia sp. Nafp2/4-1b]
MKHRFLYIDNIKIDFVFRTIKIDGKAVCMTPCAFDVLECLLDNKNEIVSRGAIQTAVWGRDLDASSRTLEVHISQIRSKLRLDEDKNMRIIPAYAVGYRLVLHGEVMCNMELDDTGSATRPALQHTMTG